MGPFQDRYPFPFDPFQTDAMQALDEGRSVLVAAPTGSGKTVVAEYAVHLGLGRGSKTFYTTPLKALSNQKFGDFVAQYGASQVGLLTGDNSINSDAPIVVMTTEVLRNMLYERSDSLNGLAYVVMDEVHYLQDPYRGAVWEEVLIHLPMSVDVVCLSATISNAEEFGEWIGTLRGPTEVVIEERRPVPLQHHYLVGHELHPMHVEEGGRLLPNPYLVSLEQRGPKAVGHERGRYGQHRQHRRTPPREASQRFFVPRREDVVGILDEHGMLPAIYFIFSRAGCDRSVEYLMSSGIRLTTPQEEERIREFAQMRAAWMDEGDLATLGFYEFLEALAAGISSHHAGMLPLFKETVEELFESGLVKVVFATETLSLGINMPARTVIIEDLWKFQGERHELLTPGQYTQLTGRAGRRGIDELGHAVVVMQQNVEFSKVASLASTRTYELRSSFRPSYNMSVNLVRNYTPEQAQTLLDSSFAQFLADRGVVALERQIKTDERAKEKLQVGMGCHLGDFEEYWNLKERARTIRENARRDREDSRADEIKAALGSLRPGDVIFVPTTRRRGLAAIVSVQDGKPTAVTQDRREKPFRLLPRDFREPPESVARIVLPRSGRAQSPKFRRDVSVALAALDVRPPRSGRRPHEKGEIRQAEGFEREAEQHPCSRCPDRPDHERVALQIARLTASLDKAGKRIRGRTETLARQFERVLEVLRELGYVSDFRILPKGEMLAHIYGESDILVTEAIEAGVFDGITPAEMAALVSSLVYESRERFPRPAEMPTAEADRRFRQLLRVWKTVRKVEDAHHVELCRELEAGFAEPIWRWAEGGDLAHALDQTRMTAGDFVRNCKQLLDLLRQIEDVSSDKSIPKAAREAINRGVIAYTGI